MADADFDVVRLAEYLHLAVAQVVRLADRGEIPGRKVGGEWRFAPGDVHHWLERRIGASDDDELAQVEAALERSAGPEEEQPLIARMMPVSAIAVPLAARTRGSAMSGMVELAAGTGWLWDPAKMLEAVKAREAMSPTALDNGVALLHPRRPLPTILEQACIAFGRTAQGIPFGHSRGVLTDLFFLICSVDDRGHLRTLARLSRLLSDPSVLAALREADDAASVHNLIAERETEIAEG